MATKPGGEYINDLPDSAEGKGYYDLDSTVGEYLALHYPDGDPLHALLGDRTPPVETRFPFAIRTLWEPRPNGFGLDVGAATGRVTFDLARDHAGAWGLDLSSALIRGAKRVQSEGIARYTTQLEGNLRTPHDVPVASAANARFVVGDALHLPFPEARFETVVALNLVDRVPDPARALDELARMVAPGGILIVASPYTWLATFTSESAWLGGYEEDGKPIRGFEQVCNRLAAAAFDLERELRMPFYIPHHARSGQLGVAHVQRFRRKK